MDRHRGALGNRLSAGVCHRRTDREFVRAFVWLELSRYLESRDARSICSRLALAAQPLPIRPGPIWDLSIPEGIVFVTLDPEYCRPHLRRPFSSRIDNRAAEIEARLRLRGDQLTRDVIGLRRPDLNLELGNAELGHGESHIGDIASALITQQDRVAPGGSIRRERNLAAERPHVAELNLCGHEVAELRIADSQRNSRIGSRDRIRGVIVMTHDAFVEDSFAGPIDGPVREQMPRGLREIRARRDFQAAGRDAELPPGRGNAVSLPLVDPHEIMTIRSAPRFLVRSHCEPGEAIAVGAGEFVLAQRSSLHPRCSDGRLS